ncbi:hypothetical protein TBS_16920 [Thermobispora bispora]|jgi:uncharacterized membrane protein YkvA (DUF1232 family)|uniref:DUF1232 domain-containing protein n=1 Tax=Thermobispora bispora (strain ATCC 19993 / DSM 43833 / CBS 139.67 / JCM 10125 / KCTC 9307 / NBRC 14880 / R51) TaxID=469371 RepID=D6YAG0_THEBD|nr:YkvA family protein [Thermobispora bispora]ADG90213.1 protein of unknown function DUF1232 [Thermobispora bispora DSM 43833]MBO2473271.1 DUF1232 domain-containing protein [Actinomycetales bacterium]MBX6167295.1 DUF1232 domain-containing protein [Thermobispora bispora]QSI46649.1 DUF1232 domain-containing protein [Thermobispora bispora]
MSKAKARNRALAALHAYRELSRPGSPSLGTRIKALPGMLRAALRGEYPAMGKRRLAMLVLALAYLISPIDAIPDFLVGIGVVDDFGVALWLLTGLLQESGRYAEWVRRQAGPAGKAAGTPQSVSIRSHARDGSG